MPAPTPADPAFALALLGLEGVGRVTAHRLLERFPTPEALALAPREQVLLRIKGAPRAAHTVERLFDEAVLGPALAAARAEVAALAARRLGVLAPGHAHWPAGLDALDRADRPVVLYTFGDAAALARPGVALFARPPVPGPPYEAAQDVARALLADGVPPVVGAQPGFDVVVHKLAAGVGRPCVMVAAAGLAQIPPPARPSVAAAVRAGGVLVSPFPMNHGPFPHDDHERALAMAAMARAAVFVNPAPETPEARALAWAAEHGRPVFGADASATAPTDLRPLPVVSPAALSAALDGADPDLARPGGALPS